MPPDVGGMFQKKPPNQQVMLDLLLEIRLGQAREELELLTKGICLGFGSPASNLALADPSS